MIAWFNAASVLVRVCIAAGVVLTVFGGVHFYNESQRMKGEARVIERSKTQGKINETKSRKAHERASAPGAPKRVLEKFCRDCD
jgi:negative regulator of sigma E activity